MAGSFSTYLAGSWMISACQGARTIVCGGHYGLWTFITSSSSACFHADLQLALHVRPKEGLGNQRMQRRIGRRYTRSEVRALIQPLHHLQIV
jgi:hypothetical protein